MPRIDDGSAKSGPGRHLKSAWATLSVEEAQDIHAALEAWAADVAAGQSDPQWHVHITDTDGNELTIAIVPGDEK